MLIKICGIKTVETLLCCEKNNVNFFGMIFYKNSPRNIDFENALTLQSQAIKLKIKGVAVFVDEKIENIRLLIKNLNLEYVQLHGEEDETYMKSLKEFNVKIVKKISIRGNSDLDEITKYKSADYFLFDYKPKKNELPGGNAKSFNWNLIKNLDIDKPWFLSGGINLGNIQFLKKNINPFGIDLSSGVEKDLGIKDNHIINNFIDNLKNA